MMEKAKVYFTKELTPEAMVKMYEALGVKLPGKVAVKLHSGEVGNQNFIRPAFLKPVIDHVNGTIVECNTAYEGKRNTTKDHWETMKLHGWTDICTPPRSPKRRNWNWLRTSSGAKCPNMCSTS